MSAGRTWSYALAAFAVIVGVPALVVAANGRPDVAIGLVVGFLVLLAITAYALRVVAREKRRELE